MEATPHHLFLAQGMFEEDDTRARVNPPIRDEETRRGLWSCWEKTSWKPAAILGIPRAGFEPGDRADYALYPDEVTRIDASRLHAKCGWSPFEGLDAVFPKEVVIGGKRAYACGDYREACAAWYPGQGYLYDPRDNPGARQARLAYGYDRVRIGSSRL
ncbi:MAG: Dihydroorotase, multifunctional complex type [Methanoculleus marisnigri]|uniref:Dihydroorotase, multifunctional complex type n=1 Tax=Methanoculleus marisnigri TaxID=2198 RepID=A0A101GR74_9EURY|nr:MAG: Dihydroorotase, multifunctional complex type [Methanoculleus marisnigri]